MSCIKIRSANFVLGAVTGKKDEQTAKQTDRLKNGQIYRWTDLQTDGIILKTLVKIDM